MGQGGGWILRTEGKGVVVLARAFSMAMERVGGGKFQLNSERDDRPSLSSFT